MQILVSHCPEQICHSFFADLVLSKSGTFSDFEWGISSLYNSMEIKLLPSDLEPSKEAVSFLLSVLWFCWVSGFYGCNFFSKCLFLFHFIYLHVAAWKEFQSTNGQCQTVPTFNLRSIHFYQYNNPKIPHWQQWSYLFSLLFSQAKQKLILCFTDIFSYLLSC